MMRGSQLPIVALGAAWSLAILWTCGSLWDHAYRPAKNPTDFPAPFAADETTSSSRIVLFAHPFCPCTKATLSELEESLSRLPANVAVAVVFVTVGLPPAEVSASPLMAMARSLPHVTVKQDDAGHLACSYGATVSGETFFVDSRGRVLYHGGLTPARGHQGDATGQTLLEQVARGKREGPCAAPIFGCSLPHS
jgi:hypothetical protein